LQPEAINTIKMAKHSALAPRQTSLRVVLFGRVFGKTPISIGKRLEEFINHHMNEVPFQKQLQKAVAVRLFSGNRQRGILGTRPAISLFAGNRSQG
jgi:hypothetical protein